MGRLRMDDRGHHSVDRGGPDPVDDEQDDDTDRGGHPSGEEPAQRFVQFHLQRRSAPVSTEEGFRIRNAPGRMVGGVEGYGATPGLAGSHLLVESMYRRNADHSLPAASLACRGQVAAEWPAINGSFAGQHLLRWSSGSSG